MNYLDDRSVENIRLLDFLRDAEIEADVLRFIRKNSQKEFMIDILADVDTELLRKFNTLEIDEDELRKFCRLFINSCYSYARRSRLM